VAGAVEVERPYLDVRRRQETGLADLAGKGADQIAATAGRRAATICSAADQLAWNNSECGGQSQASEASVRTTGNLPMSPPPLRSPASRSPSQLFRHAEALSSMRDSSCACFCIRLLRALDARRDDARAGVFLEALAWNMPRWRGRSQHVLVDGGRDKASLMTCCETPAAAASRAIAAMKVLKSPPHLAASAGV